MVEFWRGCKRFCGGRVLYITLIGGIVVSERLAKIRGGRRPPLFPTNIFSLIFLALSEFLESTVRLMNCVSSLDILDLRSINVFSDPVKKRNQISFYFYHFGISETYSVLFFNQRNDVLYLSKKSHFGTNT